MYKALPKGSERSPNASALTKRPVQVYLRPEQLEALRYQARRRKVTVAELAREGVDRILADVPPEEDPIWELANLVQNGPSDASERHDGYLAEIIGGESR